jgi:hypothetical protein
VIDVRHDGDVAQLMTDRGQAKAPGRAWGLAQPGDGAEALARERRRPGGPAPWGSEGQSPTLATPNISTRRSTS